MIAPRIHMNGDAKSTLVNAIFSASLAINTASDLLRETRPNARNYYVISPSAFRQAEVEHKSRVLRLQAIHDELLAMFMAIEQDEIDFTVEG